MNEVATDICGIRFPSAVINAAGAKDVSAGDLEALGQSESGAIVIKTTTKAFRPGNDLPRWHVDARGSLNSMGLPNLGIERYLSLVPVLKRWNKPLIASVSGIGEGDNEEMIAAYDKAGVDMIEVNLSCPNLAGKGQLGYDFAASRKMLESCRAVTKLPLGVKLPPYFDASQFEEMARVLRETNVDFIVTINSIGNALVIDPEKEEKVIAPNGGFGGLGGGYVKPTALANVHKFHQLLGGVPIIGVGGVASGTDAFEHLLAGASAVGVGTALVSEGPAVFMRINRELAGILKEHGYADPTAARGKLKDKSGVPAEEAPATTQAR
ncbi:MAG: dihydroorotate oxidase [bacterium]|nr:dihydroorotate oxidase [bacterium]